MKILLIEDDEAKANQILVFLKGKGVADKSIIRAKNMSDFAAALSHDIGLFIIDFNLPHSDDGVSCPNGGAILETIVKAGKSNALLVAISSYPDEFPALREKYESQGCILADFSKQTVWQSVLTQMLIQLNKDIRFDFLIFCALEEERKPYSIQEGAKLVNRGGVDCLDIDIGDRKGSAILLPNMGLVNAAITAGLCIDKFKPSIVGMSGICGGFEGRAKLGQLFVSKMAYEYQSGKWASDGFQQEPYQVSTHPEVITMMRSLVADEQLLEELERGIRENRPRNQAKPELGIFTSGSAVIADRQYMEQIKEIHRKVDVLDMEVFSIKRAAELASHRPPCICAKTVVDLGDSGKDDDLHTYGAIISARFLVKALERFFLATED